VTVTEKRHTFRELHQRGCFVMPNPWDVGSARYLQGLGFKALASTSAGYAFTRGLPDNAVGRDMMLAHLRDLSAPTDVPINADFEGGYAHEAENVSDNVGVTMVKTLINGGPVCLKTAAPYSCPVTLSGTAATIDVIAYDAAGNSRTAEVNVKVAP